MLIEDRWWESDYQGVLTPMPNEQESGETLNGWVMDTEGNTLYYRDGKPLSGGFYDIDGEYRFFHDNGRMAKSESLYLDNHWVRFDEDGHVISDTNREPETQDFSESTTENSVSAPPSSGRRISTPPGSNRKQFCICNIMADPLLTRYFITL